MLNINNTFGKYLMELRGEMSLREAAQKTGISHTYIRDLELGKKTEPSHDALAKLAKAYGVKYGDLLSKKFNEIDYPNILIKYGDSNKIPPLYLERLKTNGEAREYFLIQLEDIFNILTVKENFLETIESDLNTLQEKYNSCLEDGENITPEWLRHQVLEAEYDSEWIYDLIADLQSIVKKYNLDLELKTFLLKEKITYSGHEITDKEKQLITAYLEGLFSNRE